MTTKTVPDVCEKHGQQRQWRDCYQCGGEGVAGHDCGDDTCCCLHPIDNDRCEVCGGKGGWYQCFTCAPFED